MVKINGQEVEWKKFPEGWFLTDVQYHLLWKNNETEAMFILIKIPKGDAHELHHMHPQADQMGFGLSGSIIRDGTLITAREGDYTFRFPLPWRRKSNARARSLILRASLGSNKVKVSN